MPEENVEIVRRILGDWARGEFGSWTEFADPAITFETFMPDTSENVVARGLAEFQGFTRGWLAQWQDYRIVGEDLRQVGRDKVFAAVRQSAAGRHSGAEVESPGYSVWTLREGKVVSLSLHYDRDRALEAAGLS